MDADTSRHDGRSSGTNQLVADFFRCRWQRVVWPDLYTQITKAVSLYVAATDKCPWGLAKNYPKPGFDAAFTFLRLESNWCEGVVPVCS